MVKTSGPYAAIGAQKLINAAPGTPLPNNNIPINLNVPPIDINEIPHIQTVENVANVSQKLVQKAKYFTKSFESYLTLTPNESFIGEFDKIVSKFSNFLFEANNQIPCFQNPAVSFYRKCK